MQRRTMLRAGIAIGASAALTPRTLWAAYPVKAFLAGDAADALREVLGSADIGESDRIEIDAPLIATDANLVPVRIRANFTATESISLVVTGNEAPFTAHFRLHEAHNFVTTRIRMQDGGDLLVVVKADGALHAARRPVRVGLDRCGV